MKRMMLLVLCVGFLGCTSKTSRIEGEVVKVSGTLPTLVDSSGALFGNASVRLAYPSLVYTVKVGEDIYTLDILESRRISRANLASRICVGTRISFVVRIVDWSNNKGFDPNHHAGSYYADNIGVANPCVK